MTPPKKDAVAIFNPQLDQIEGWLGLSSKKQGELFEHARNIWQNRQMQLLGEFGELMEVHQVEQLVEGTTVKMPHVMRHLYQGKTIRTAERKYKRYKEFVKIVPPDALERMKTFNIDMITKFERIAHAALGDIANALKKLPELPAETFFESLDEQLLEDRQAKRKGKRAGMNEQMAAKMATNALIRYIRECGLASSAEKRRWLQRVVSWVMEAQAVSGSLRTVSRTPIPDGVLIRRGRPRKHPEKEAA